VRVSYDTRIDKVQVYFDFIGVEVLEVNGNIGGNNLRIWYLKLK
jgi:hypothetical protein